MAVHQSTASNLVRGLVDRQLVEATKDDVDRRAVQLHLTPAGTRLLQGAPGPFAGVLPDALKALDVATLKRLEGDLARLIQVLGADEGGAAIPLSGL
jgi:DNA-binding MarR family transcriptional regulator